jgi:aconitate hydratase
MAPEYGATVGFFPIDSETLKYLSLTGRPVEQIELVERYSKEQNLYRTNGTPDPVFTEQLKLDLSSVEPSLAGPKRPQDRVSLNKMKRNFRESLQLQKSTEASNYRSRRLPKGNGWNERKSGRSAMEVW